MSKRVGDGRADLEKLTRRVERGELVAPRVMAGLEKRLTSIRVERERLRRLEEDIEMLLSSAERNRDRHNDWLRETGSAVRRQGGATAPTGKAAGSASGAPVRGATRLP